MEQNSLTASQVASNEVLTYTNSLIEKQLILVHTNFILEMTWVQINMVHMSSHHENYTFEL